MPFLSPNQQCQGTEGKLSHSMDMLTLSSPGVFQLCLWPLIAPGYLGGKVAMPLISPLMPVPQSENTVTMKWIKICKCVRFHVRPRRYEEATTELHVVSKKWATYFYDDFGKRGSIFVIFFTVKFRKDLRRKTELKLPPPLKSVAKLPCEKLNGQLCSFTAQLIQFNVMKNV